MRRLLDAVLALMGVGPILVQFSAEDEELSRRVARRWARYHLADHNNRDKEDKSADLEIDIMLAIREFTEIDRRSREAQRLRDQCEGKALQYEEASLQ